MLNEINIAVRQLVEYSLQSGDLNLESFMGNSRAKAGIKAHQKVQKARPTEYSPEVTLSFTTIHPKFLLTINGRVDGIYTYPDKIIIDEIKSTTKSLDSFSIESDIMHWGQAKVYAYIYACQQKLESIWIQLTYYNIDNRKQLELQKEYTFTELEEFFNGITTKYLGWAEVIFDWQQARNSSAEKLKFPYPEYRLGQRKMAVEAYRTFRDSGQMLISAPTGIGKTLAALFPAVKSYPSGDLNKIFYFSARTTGKDLAKNACIILQDKQAKIKTLVLTAKEKICFEPDKACNAEECKYAKGFYDRLQPTVEEIFSENLFDRETITAYAQKYEICPFEFTLAMSLWSDIIICDYNYGFDPKVHLRRFFGEDILQRDYIFLIDEAHNLVDRSRDMFSAELSKQAILDVRRPLKNTLPKIYNALGKINNLFLKFRKLAETEDNFYFEPNAPEELYPLLKSFIFASEKWLAQNIPSPHRTSLLEVYFEAIWFAKVLEEYDSHYITTYEKMKNELVIKLFCVDPSQQMREALKRCKSAMFFSATLTPQSYFAELFGCEEDAKKLLLSSPFPKENLLVMRSDISTRYKDRIFTYEDLTALLIQMVSVKKGNYLLFFPSYKYLQMIYSQLIEEQPEIKTIVQESGMRELEREEFIAKFSGDNSETLVGFAVMGGVFGEGIDLVGDRLDGVAIVGVGLPGISKERDLILNYHNQEDQGFQYAYQYPGINRVLQAAGRVIRTSTDRGIVLLIDDRFRWSTYRQLLPPNWKVKPVNNGDTLKIHLNKFWGK